MDFFYKDKKPDCKNEPELLLIITKKKKELVFLIQRREI
jgi:hypothetical protein